MKLSNTTIVSRVALISLGVAMALMAGPMV